MMITSRRSVRLMGWLAISNWSRIRPASKLSRQATTLTLRPSGGAGAGRSVKVEEQSSRTKSWTKWHSHRIMPLTGVASHTRSSITINSAVSNSFNLRIFQQCCAVSFSQLLSNALQISFFAHFKGHEVNHLANATLMNHLGPNSLKGGLKLCQYIWNI